MLFDRPEMATYVVEGDALWTWAVSGFEGASHGFPIHWDAAWPRNGVLASHACPEERLPAAKIHLRPVDGTQSDWEAFESLWSLFVFEVENLRTAREYEELCRSAVREAMNREEWVARNTRLEYEAIERTRRFYFSLWVPWSASIGQVPLARHWYIGYDRTYDEWRERDQQRADSVFLLWSRYYDDWVLPQLARSGSEGCASE